MTRWLAIVCEEAYDDEELWLKLIEFLEKRVKGATAEGTHSRENWG